MFVFYNNREGRVKNSPLINLSSIEAVVLRKIWIFLAVTISILLSSIDNTAVSVALPAITKAFNTNILVSGWVMSIYMLVSMSSMPLAVRISEIVGSKKALFYAQLLFISGSILCMLAPNIQLLILFRAMQGIGGSGFLPIGTTIISEEFPESRQRSIGLISSILPLGTIIGPNVGGLMVDSLGWNSIYWINIPFGIIVIAAVWLLLPARKRLTGRQQRLDIKGACLFFCSVGAFMLALTLLGDYVSVASVWHYAIIGALILSSAFFMIIFIATRTRCRTIINVRLLRAKPFVGATYLILSSAPVFWCFFADTPVCCFCFGMSTVQSGFILTPRSICMIVGATTTVFC
jgi:MFS family permease